MGAIVSILMIDNSSNYGGAINSLSNLVTALDKKRFVPVIVSGQPEDFLKSEFKDCIYYQFIPKLSWINNRIYKKILSFPLFQKLLFRKIINVIRFMYWIVFINFPEALKYCRMGKKHEVDLLHLNNIFGSQFSGIIAAKLLRVPCVAHLRDFEEVHPITRIFARLINHHIAISEAIKANLLQLAIPLERISLIHDGINLEKFNSNTECQYLFSEFNLSPGTPRFGIFGRMVAWKGIREFLYSAQRVFESFPEARAFIVGGPSTDDDEYFSEMVKLTVELGIERNVIFTGYRLDVSALMKFMDVIVHASNRPEPFGMVIVEAMALEKPVVATRGGGPLDIVTEGETGYLVEMGDIDEMWKVLVYLLQHPKFAKEMGRKGRLRVEEKFSNKMYAAKIEKVYLKLCQDFKR